MQEDGPQFGITYTSTTVVYLKIKAIKYIHKPDIFLVLDACMKEERHF